MTSAARHSQHRLDQIVSEAGSGSEEARYARRSRSPGRRGTICLDRPICGSIDGADGVPANLEEDLVPLPSTVLFQEREEEVKLRLERTVVPRRNPSRLDSSLHGLEDTRDQPLHLHVPEHLLASPESFGRQYELAEGVTYSVDAGLGSCNSLEVSPPVLGEADLERKHIDSEDGHLEQGVEFYRPGGLHTDLQEGVRERGDDLRVNRHRRRGDCAEQQKARGQPGDSGLESATLQAGRVRSSNRLDAVGRSAGEMHVGPMVSYDYVLIGGGLQNALVALAVRAHQPDARVALVERSQRLGGNHTWCLHLGDIPDSARSWIEPLLTYRWPSYKVAFPGLERTIEASYVGVSSERLDYVVTRAIQSHSGSRLLLETEAVEVSADRVVLSNGTEIGGTAVVDARGLDERSGIPCGYQKFVGIEVDLESDHGMSVPLLMDARVDQAEGYRFMYVLPISDRTVLLEDTYFNRSPTLDRAAIRDRIHDYVEARGWAVRRVRREEVGVLPMPCEGRRIRVSTGPLLAGYRGGWFHPGTGYSFPIAIRLAEAVGSGAPEGAGGAGVRALAADVSGQARFARFLNRLLFRWYPPIARRAIFERFFRLPEDTIGRFFGLRTTPADRWKLLVGRPPSGLSIRYRFGGDRR